MTDDATINIAFNRQPTWMPDGSWELSIEVGFCESRQTCAALMRETMMSAGITHLGPEVLKMRFEGFEIEGDAGEPNVESWSAHVSCSVMAPALPAKEPASLTIGKGKYVRGQPYPPNLLNRNRQAERCINDPSQAKLHKGADMPVKEDA